MGALEARPAAWLASPLVLDRAHFDRLVLEGAPVAGVGVEVLDWS